MAAFQANDGGIVNLKGDVREVVMIDLTDGKRLEMSPDSQDSGLGWLKPVE